jgi:hypothetical protein
MLLVDCESWGETNSRQRSSSDGLMISLYSEYELHVNCFAPTGGDAFWIEPLQGAAQSKLLGEQLVSPPCRVSDGARRNRSLPLQSLQYSSKKQGGRGCRTEARQSNYRSTNSRSKNPLPDPNHVGVARAVIQHVALQMDLEVQSLDQFL